MSQDIPRNEGTEVKQNNVPPTPSAKNQGGGTFQHISDVGTWKHADRNFWVFVALSIFTGFLGLDHFYVRSNETAIKKLLVNVLGFGFWYFYDLIQVITEGNKIRTEGLSSPLDWIQGIGRGMFEIPKKKEETENGPTFSAPKSYMLFTILAVALGAFGADKFYLGYNFQGMVKFMSVFSIIFTIFGLVWVFYDAFYAMFMTNSLMKDGISAPPPFSFFFRKPIPAKELFEVQEEKEKQPFSIWDYIPIVGFFKKIGGFVPTVVEEVVQPLVGPSVCAVKKHAETAGELGRLGSSLITNTFATAPALVNSVVDQVNAMTDIGAIQKMAEEHAKSQMDLK